MAKRRRGAVNAIAAMPVPSDEGPEHVSVDVRKISNGYVASHSRSQDGEYHHHEEYHKDKPNVKEILGAREPREQRSATNHLRGAVGLLRRGKA